MGFIRENITKSRKIFRNNIRMNDNKPEKFALYWVDDEIGRDWFVLVPSYDNCGDYFEIELAEEYHSSYEDLPYDLYGGGMFAECNANFVCYVPISLLENTEVSRFDMNGRKIKDSTISYLQASKESYMELVERIDIIDDVLHNEMLPDFPKELKDEITSSENPIDYTYDFFMENFENTEAMEALLEDVYGIGKNDPDMIDIVLFFLYNVRISKHLDFLINKPFGCLHAQTDILSQIEGMSRIDEGDKSIFRTYVYDGCLYQEGGNVVRINKRKE